jgi:hypothetical protein
MITDGVRTYTMATFARFRHVATFYQVKFRQFATFGERIEGMYEISEVNEGAR